MCLASLFLCLLEVSVCPVNIRHQISLYACVSHLKWNYDAGDHVSGRTYHFVLCISCSSSKGSLPFTLARSCTHPFVGLVSVGLCDFDTDVFFADEIRPFDFHPDENLSEVELCNRLWELLARDA